MLIEVAAGEAADSTAPSWSRLVPLTWPQPVRVAWWLFVATCAAGFRWNLHRFGMRQRAWIVVGSVAPFVALAVGVATDATWATWH